MVPAHYKQKLVQMIRFEVTGFNHFLAQFHLLAIIHLSHIIFSSHILPCN
jgi:hypothetical protein